MSKPRHLYIFEVVGNNGKKDQIHSWAKVHTLSKKKKKRVVELLLTEANVRRSMGLHGAGNTQTCSVAVCAIENADKFDHPVVGYIDFYHRTAFVASKLSGETRLPNECYRYTHNFAWVAMLNDRPGGYKELLDYIKRNGPIVIRLWARYRKDRTKTGGNHTTRDGSRSTRLRGAKLRHATATVGGVPA